MAPSVPLAARNAMASPRWSVFAAVDARQAAAAPPATPARRGAPVGVTLVNSYVTQWERRRALALLATAMRDTGKVALAQEVSHGKCAGVQSSNRPSNRGRRGKA